MSLVQIVRSLLLPDFLSADPVASTCWISRSSAEQDQFLSGNSSNNFLALQNDMPMTMHRSKSKQKLNTDMAAGRFPKPEVVFSSMD